MTSSQATIRPAYALEETQAALIRSVFAWMTLGLTVTGFVASVVIHMPALSFLYQGPILFVLLFLELGLVFWLSARVMQMSPSTGSMMFLVYSALNGVTLAPIAFVYTGESIASAFVVTGGLFGVMSLYGYVTKRSLAGFGGFLLMGLVGLILASIVNIFIMSNALSFACSVVGVLIFTGLTAYHVQRIKQSGAQVQSGSDEFRRLAILGALSLYLDFINLFLYLLRFFGRRD